MNYNPRTHNTIDPKQTRLASGLGPPLHIHVVAQTGRIDRRAVIVQGPVQKSRIESIRVHIIFGTRARIDVEYIRETKGGEIKMLTRWRSGPNSFLATILERKQ